MTGAALEFVDDRTGERLRLEMEVVPSEKDPRRFSCRVKTGYAEQDLAHLSVTALISTKGCADYPICEGLSEPSE